MKKCGCRYCMCPEVEATSFRLHELPLMFLLRRPALCLHCRQRQLVFPILLSRLIRFFIRPPEVALKYRR